MASFPAAREAERAITSFERAGNQAGALGARVERLYALNRSLVVKACLEVGKGLEPELEKRRYVLPLVRYRLEIAGCVGRGYRYGEAESQMRRALKTARDAHYPAIELRALSLLANHHNGTGNSTEGWAECWEGLGRFWAGSYGPLRGHTLYFNCASAAERLGNPELALALEQEASAFASQSPNHFQTAEGFAREARLAAGLGEAPMAARALKRGREALLQLPDDDLRRKYEWWLEKARAEGELRAGKVASAISILQTFGLTLGQSEQPNERADYYRLRALAAAQTGDRQEQLRFLTLATNEMERALPSLPRENERILWRNLSGSVLRPMVASTLAEPDGAAKAFELWEQYLDRSVAPNGTRTQESTLPLSSLQSATVVSFLWLPDRVGYWVADNGGIAFQWSPGAASKIAGLCRRLARQCSDETIPNEAVRRTGGELYAQLFSSSIANRRLEGRELLIEADGELGGIPFEALVEPDGRYLAEDHSIVYSPGLRRWARVSAKPGLSASAATLIVAAPTVGGKLVKQFPPLPDARREGDVVAAAFPRAIILAGRSGTLPAVIAGLGTAELFHFSGHGLSNSDDGALLLAPSEEGGDASLLTTGELANLSLPHCRLAVLSACSSGVGESKGPVNPRSLVSGLLRAGVGDVIASRWPVDSASTLLLMRNFYSRLASTGDPGSALQEAARQIRENPATCHPYYWAAFVIFGR